MWALIAEAAILVGTYIYHRWFQDQPQVLRWQQMTLPRAAEGTPVPMVYGTIRVRNPVMVWSGNQLEPGDHVNPFEPGPGTANGLDSPGSDPVTDHFSVDMLFVLGIPPYSPPSTLFGNNIQMGNMWYGDAHVGTLVPNGFDIGTPGISGFYAGHFAFPDHDDEDTIPLQRDEWNVAGIFYAGRSDGIFPLDSTNTQPFNIFRPSGAINQVQNTYPDRIYYTASGDCSTLAALSQAGDAGKIGAMRNQIAVYMHVGLGQSSTVSGFSFEVTAPTNFTAADLGTLDWHTPPTANPRGLECDPTAALFDVLTSPWGKLGIDKSRIDMASFQAASQTLWNEGIGYSRYIDQATDASQIIDEIKQQTDGVLYEEPTTGKLVFRLIRFDYNVGLLDDVNPNNAIPDGSGWYSVQSWAEVPNQVKITFTDRNKSYQDSVVVAQDPVIAIANGGRLRTVTFSFPGVCTAGQAQIIAARELNAVSRPMVKATVKVSRAFYAHRQGDVVTFTWPDLGINKMVMRIAGIDFGQLHDSSITLMLMRDVFDVQTGAFPHFGG